MRYRFSNHKTFVLSVALSGLMLPALPLHATELPTIAGQMTAETTAKVLAVDSKKHSVDVEAQNGKKSTLQLTEDARNLDQLKVGDTISLKIVRSTAVNILEPGSATLGAATVQGGDRALPGAMPGVNAYSETTIVSKIVKIDLAKNEVTLLGADGKDHPIPVENPDVQAKLKNLKVGQLVSIVSRDAISVTTAHPE